MGLALKRLRILLFLQLVKDVVVLNCLQQVVAVHIFCCFSLNVVVNDSVSTNYFSQVSRSFERYIASLSNALANFSFMFEIEQCFFMV